MRRLLTYALLTLSMTLIAAVNAGAQGLPQGSYQQSCNNVSVNGASLYAECQDSSGNWKNTSLPDFQGCSGDIINDNGHLRCLGNSSSTSYYGGYQNGNGPNGSYVQSCQDVHTSGDDLNARCQGRDGSWHKTKLDDYQKCRGDIVNDDGKLRCVSGRYAGGPVNSPYYGNYQNVNDPNGSYTQTCREIRAEGDDLKARCQTREGGWRAAKLDDYQKCRGDIINEDGKLRCLNGVTGVSVNAPYGNTYGTASYLQTCENIHSDGDDLKARCQTRDGRWRDAKLDDYRKCKSDIVNDDGKLHCEK